MARAGLPQPRVSAQWPSTPGTMSVCAAAGLSVQLSQWLWTVWGRSHRQQ